MLGVRVIYIIATSNSLNNITLGLYILSTILNEPNVVLQNTLLVKFYTKKYFQGISYLQCTLVSSDTSCGRTNLNYTGSSTRVHS
jgi:hypothetical protein